MKTFHTVRGMRDFLPEDLIKRRLVEETVRQCFRLYGYQEIETPVVESLELIAAKAGEEIRHRLYAFQDLGGRQVAMRPEMTASVARVVAEKLRSEVKPLRLGYLANCFRYDNPQMGRYREFWQAGFELFGSEKAEADAEILIVFHDLMKRLGFHDFTTKVGNVGILRGVLDAAGVIEADQNMLLGLLDKRRITKALRFLEQRKVADNSRAVIKRLIALRGVNWTRIIAKGHAVLGENTAALTALRNLEAIVQLAEAGGVTSPLLVDLGFARGLEYYTGMIFEVFAPHLRIAAGGGGRYDRLVELFGGEPTSAVGSAPGIDRIVLAMEKTGLFSDKRTPPAEVMVIPIGEELVSQALEIASLLRSHGVSAQMEVSDRSLRSALSYANRKGFPLAVIVGAREWEKGSVTLRDLKSQTQKDCPKVTIVEEITMNLKA